MRHSFYSKNASSFSKVCLRRVDLKCLICIHIINNSVLCVLLFTFKMRRYDKGCVNNVSFFAFNIPLTPHTSLMANPEIITELGRRFKECRLAYKLT